MPIPNTVRTASMIGATVVVALSLNLGVLHLDDAETTGGAQAVAASAGETSPTTPVPPTESAPLDQTGLVSAPTVGDTNNQVPMPTAAGADPAGNGGGVGQAVPRAGQATAATSAMSAMSAMSAPPEVSGTPVAVIPSPPKPSVTTITADEPSAATPMPQPAITAPSEHRGPETAPPITEYLTYEFRDVASIIIALHGGGGLQFWSAIPEAGWVFRVDDDRPDKVKITFRPADGGDEAKFEVKSENGQLEVEQEY